MKSPIVLFKNLNNLEPPTMKRLADSLSALVQGRLWVKVVIGLVLGLICGMLLGPELKLITPKTADMVGKWLAMPGQLFLALIQMIVVPLVVASIINGLAGCENVEQLRKMGLRVAFFFLVSTAVAAVVGLSIAMIVKPGMSLDHAALSSNLNVSPPQHIESATLPAISEIPQKLLTLLPGNPLTAMAENQMLEVVVFSIIVGVALLSINTKQSKPMLEILGSLQEVCMVIVRWAMVLAPFAVFGLMAQLAMKIGIDIMIAMGIYVLTVLAGLLSMFCLYLILVMMVAKISPSRFLVSTREVLLLAFSTSSSAAVMPLTIKTAEEKLHVKPSVAQFVIPLGATINMNGTALYQAVAVVFLAQAYGIDLSIAHFLLITVMAVGASIGSPATPGVGIVILAMVVSTIGIPPSGLALIMGVDRILDMSRTAINVSGDLLAAKLVDKWLGEENPQQIPQENP